MTINVIKRATLKYIDAELQTTLELLQAGEPLSEKYHDHALVRNWIGHRD